VRATGANLIVIAHRQAQWLKDFSRSAKHKSPFTNVRICRATPMGFASLVVVD
jgi:hypothetical protein